MGESCRLTPLAELLRSYSFGYTAAHDFDVCDRIMAPDYLLVMGPAQVSGREENYKPATRRMYGQFPGLGFAVHDLLLGTERAALRFTEHGRSTRTGTQASWRGISLYRTAPGPGTLRLGQCRVEQDYHARGRQLESGRPDPVPAPALDPWNVAAAAPRPDVERAVRDWLADPAFLYSPGLEVDDEAWVPANRVRIENTASTVLDLFSAGDRAAFHARLSGGYRSGLPVAAGLAGRPVDLYVTGIVSVDADGAVGGHLVTDRYTAARRL